MEEQPASEESPADKFFKYFQHELTDLQEKMSQLESQDSSSGGERSHAISHCKASITRLSNEVRNASSYISARERKVYSDAIKGLSQNLETIQDSFQPKPKFSFKSGSSFMKKNESAISINDADELAKGRWNEPAYLQDKSNESSFCTTPAEWMSPASTGDKDVAEGASNEADSDLVQTSSRSQNDAITHSDHDGVHIHLPSDASTSCPCNLSMLHRCVVDTSRSSADGKPFASVTLKNIKESVIICGRVNGAAHLTNVSNSVLVVSSRQFRMHESRNCDVYLLVSSRPIIENCSNIRFAPLPDKYMTKVDEETENRWQEVDDFKWLRSEPSPNWSLLDEAERVKPEIWRDVVSAPLGIGVEDILKAISLPK